MSALIDVFSRIVPDTDHAISDLTAISPDAFSQPLRQTLS
jgi:hypothetical protein